MTPELAIIAVALYIAGDIMTTIATVWLGRKLWRRLRR